MPSEIASCPLAESTSTFGRKFGETRSAPRSRSTSACSMIPITPPIADPKTIPTREGSNPFSEASATASFAASHVAEAVFPSGVTAPRPVTTTRRCSWFESVIGAGTIGVGHPGPAPAPHLRRRQDGRGCPERQTGTRVLLLVALRRVPKDGRVSRAGAAAPAEPRHLPAVPRGAGGPAGSRRTVRGRLELPRGCREIERFLAPWLQ